MSHTAKLSVLLLLAGLFMFSCKKKDDNPPVAPPAPVASFSYSTEVWKVSFTNTSTSDPDTLTWDFGDNSTGTGQTPVHQYASAGTYIVSLRAASAYGSSVYKDTIVLDTVVTKLKIIEISTGFGNMYMYLYDQTPLHRDNFLLLAGQGFFNGTTFHRIIPDFVIQGGDPNSKDSDTTNDGYGGPGYDIPFSAPPELHHVYGAVGAASEGAHLPSSGSQFYIVVDPNGTSFLNGNYTVFGFIMKGMDVAQQIVSQPRNLDDRPFTDIPMQVGILEKTKAEILTEYGFVVP